MQQVPRTLRRAVVKVRKSAAERGLVETARRALYSLRDRFRRREPEFTGSDWDRAFHVETAQHVALEGLSISSPNEFFGVHYEPITPHRFEEVLAAIPVAWNEYTFLDLGSGKGRAMLLAAAQPFRRVVGVEFARELHAVATRNIEAYTGPRRCRDIVSVLADAADFEFPPDPTIVFLYNPFETNVIARVLDNLRLSLERRPRQVWVAYYVPLGMPLLRNVDFLTLEHQAPGFGIYHSSLPAS